MGLTITNSGGDFEKAPEGTHMAVCRQVIDLGTQPPQAGYPARAKVLIGWELGGTKKEDGTPFVVFRRFTASTHEKATLRKVLKSWRGRDFTTEEEAAFQVRDILDASCMVTIVHNDRGYADITAVVKKPAGIDAPAPTSERVFYEIEEGTSGAFQSFSEKLQETIKGAAEWGGPSEQEHHDDDIPF